MLQLIFPFLTQAIVDKGITGKNIGLIYLILLGELMLVVSRASIDFFILALDFAAYQYAGEYFFVIRFSY